MEINRQRFRELKRKLINGDLSVFRKITNEIYEEAYKEMMTKGICDVKDTLIDSIKDVLKQEFGIGQTRFDRFISALDVYLKDFDINKINKVDNNNVIEHKELNFEEQDKINLLVILCIRQFFININKIDMGVYANPDIKLNIGSALKSIISLEDIISSKLSSDEIKKIFDRASKSMLYILSKEEIENLDHNESNLIVITIDRFYTNVHYDNKNESFLYKTEDYKLITKIKKLLEVKKYRVIIFTKDTKSLLIKGILEKNNIKVYNTLQGE